MRERTIYRGRFIRQTDGARFISPSHNEGSAIWIPKSIFTYYSNDGEGNVKFSVEGWKERDINGAGFYEV